MRVVLGGACAVVGVVLVLRPFTSLAVLVLVVGGGLIVAGVSELTGMSRADPRWPVLAGGIASIAAGVVVLVWPAITTRALAAIVGVALVVGGVLDVARAIRGSTDERAAATLSGVASVVFGVLALSWPTVTVLVVAVVFGARLVIAGWRLAWGALHPDAGPAGDVPPADPLRRRRWRRVWHVVGAALSLVVALALAALSVAIHRGQPLVDAFYDAPDDVPAEPGALLRTEPFTRTIPDGAAAWRILYTTTRADGEAALASALVVVPDDRPDGPLPVVALAHGTTGIARNCAPSVLPDPFAAGAFFVLDDVLAEGWAVVATDYIGLGTAGPHPYLVGEPSARAVLDAVRAAHVIDGVDLADETLVWGHSQGGGAALWTGMIAPTYAPDTNVIGVAALAPASDLIGLVDTLDDVVGGSIFATYVVHAYADVYPDVRVADHVRPVARETSAAVAGRCLAEPGILLSALGSLVLDMSGFRLGDGDSALFDRLAENVPDGPIDAPLLIAQGEADGLILPTLQEGYVTARCAAGQAIDYRTYPDRGHVGLVEADSPLIAELLDWTRDRWAGRPATPTCAGRPG